MIKNSLLLTVIYTLGHIVIASLLIFYLTGSSIWTAGFTALVEPAVNAIWFWILIMIWNNQNRD